MAHGTIGRIQSDRGFGFIGPDEGGPDLFFHHTALVGPSIEELRQGQRVEYDQGTDPRNPSRTRAVNVRPLDGRGRAGE